MHAVLRVIAARSDRCIDNPNDGTSGLYTLRGRARLAAVVEGRSTKWRGLPISGDLLDRHTVIVVTSHPHNIVTELSGVRPGHKDILPAHPSRASQLRCHLFVQQTQSTADLGL